MNVSVEISLYPLKETYTKTIVEFLQNLRKHPGLLIETNGMSTQIFGKYEEVMQVVQEETKKVLEKEQAMLVMKMGKGILR